MQIRLLRADGLPLRSIGWNVRDLAIAIAIAAIATLVPYHRGLQFPFALDDYTYLMQAAGFDPVGFDLRRWLAVRGYFEAMLTLAGPRVEAWHAVAFTLHAGLAVAVGAWARRFGASRFAASLAVGLFAASPLAFMVLYWIACIQELGSAAFLLAAAWCMPRADRGRWIAVPLFAAAVLCKESVLAAPFALAWVFGRRTWRVAAAMLIAGGALFVASGLHARMFATAPSLPYVTDYGARLWVHLATQIVWGVAAWRPYPDRIAAPDPRLVWPALVVVLFVAYAIWTARGDARRAIVAAVVWYVALLLPVLPLANHAYAYYGYVPQMGFVMLLGVAIDWASRRWRASVPVRVAIGAAVIVVSILAAAHNARTHESLTLPKSTVPHDSVVRAGRAADALLRGIRDAHLPGSVRRVVFTSFPSELATAASTPGPRDATGMVRIRRIPLRDALRDGDLVALHFPGMEAVWADTLTERDEGPDTAILFTAGFDQVRPLTGPTQAYFLQSQGRLGSGDREGARRDLGRVIALDPGNAPARIVLAGMEIERGNAQAARALIANVDESALAPEMQTFLREVRRTLQSVR